MDELSKILVGRRRQLGCVEGKVKRATPGLIVWPNEKVVSGIAPCPKHSFPEGCDHGTMSVTPCMFEDTTLSLFDTAQDEQDGGCKAATANTTSFEQFKLEISRSDRQSKMIIMLNWNQRQRLRKNLFFLHN